MIRKVGAVPDIETHVTGSPHHRHFYFLKCVHVS